MPTEAPARTRKRDNDRRLESTVVPQHAQERQRLCAVASAVLTK